VVLRETRRAVTPWGGLSVFVEFLRRRGFREQVRQHLPIRLESPKAIDPAETFTAFLIGVVTGARRFAHTARLRGDRALGGVGGDRAISHRRYDSQPVQAVSPEADLRILRAAVGVATGAAASTRRGLQPGPGLDRLGALRATGRSAQRLQPSEARAGVASSAAGGAGGSDVRAARRVTERPLYGGAGGRWSF